MKIKPLANRILISKIKDKSEIKMDGIILPDSMKETPNSAKVIAIGNDVVDVKVGDTVLISQYAGIPIYDDFMVFPNDILAILK